MEELRTKQDEEIRGLKEQQWQVRVLGDALGVSCFLEYFLQALKTIRTEAENQQRKVRREMVEIETKLMAYEDLTGGDVGRHRNSDKGGCRVA